MMSAKIGEVMTGQSKRLARDSSSRGSLPFKKRRLFDVVPVLNHISEPTQISLNSTTNSSTAVLTQNFSGDERFAALALVAVATAKKVPETIKSPTATHQYIAHQLPSAEPVQSFPPPQVTPKPEITLCQKSSSSSNALVGSNRQEPVSLSVPPVTPIVPTSSGGSSASSSEDGKISTSTKRSHHPPLTSPLRNGCHGRTSRNNSYCRRLPCYNRSKYCKLHYQQHMLAGARVADTGTTPSNGDASASDSGTTSSPGTCQDKRFSGFDGEVRCLATTTRGRECAYVAVKSSKYCFLHSDYDANPPPKRGSAHSTPRLNVPKKGKSSTSAEGQQTTGVMAMDGCPLIPDLTSFHNADPAAAGKSKARFRSLLTNAFKSPQGFPSRTSSAASDESSLSSELPPNDSASSKAQGKLDTTVVTASNTSAVSGTTDPSVKEESSCGSILVDCPHRLLSSVASNQWLNKQVLVGLGPLADSRGTVEKWGNGWVSVRMTSGVLHNRRSFELFLLPGGDAKHRRKATDMGSREEASKVIASLSEVEETGEFQGGVAGTVSSQETQTELDETPSTKTETKKTTPSTPGEELSASDTISHNNEKLSENARKQNGTHPSEKVPCIPVIGQEQDTLAAPLVGTARDVPLTSLLETQKVSRYKLDLLFGTAALERSRRSIYKPERYEDKALLKHRKPGSPRD